MQPEPTPTFHALGIQEPLIERLAAQGITTPTAIQAEAIPVLLAGGDAVIEAPTGTGKTLAYLLPLLQRLDPATAGPRLLVLVPGQELGIQVRDVARGMLEGTGLGVLAAIGGANPARQLEQLKKGPAVVVGTPGRIHDFLRQGKLPAAALRAVVLDEVDRLVDPGNRATTEAILKALPRGGQRVIASATVGEDVVAWSARWLSDPKELRVREAGGLPAELTHHALVVDPRDRPSVLRKLIHRSGGATLAFVNGADDIGLLVSRLDHHGVKVGGLAAGLGKVERAAVLRGFRSGKLQVLVATDLAARGLDFGEEVVQVVNVDLPTDPASYAHRVGRTARRGRAGVAITFAAPREAFVLRKLEDALGFRFTDLPAHD